MFSDPTASPTRTHYEWEQLFAGRWLFGAGLALVLLGTAFFFNLAFSSGWVDPSHRIAGGLAGGTALIGASEFFWRRKRAVYANGLSGLGSAILFLSLYAGYAVFSLMSDLVAFGAMIVVTSALCVSAYRRSSLVLGFLGLAGAVGAPLLAGQTVIRYSEIAAYLAVVASGLLVLSAARRWYALELATAAALFVYSPFIVEWTLEPAHGVAHFEAAAAAFMLFAPFATIWFVRALREPMRYQLRTEILLSSIWFVSLLEYAFRGMRVELAVSLVAFATFAIVAEHLTRGKTYAWVAIGAITAAIPAIFNQESITAIWSIEAAVLIAYGSRSADYVLRFFGYALWIFGLTHLLVAPATSGPAFLNPQFVGEMVSAATLAFISTQQRAYSAILLTDEARFAIPTHVVAVAFAVLSLAREVVNASSGNQAMVSLALTAAAGILIILGIGRRSWLLRWEALVLFAITILKVGVVDLGSLELVYRVLSTLGLGIVLVAVAAWYQFRPQTPEIES